LDHTRKKKVDPGLGTRDRNRQGDEVAPLAPGLSVILYSFKKGHDVIIDFRNSVIMNISYFNCRSIRNFILMMGPCSTHAPESFNMVYFNYYYGKRGDAFLLFQ
jgi:hypothetical protein